MVTRDASIGTVAEVFFSISVLVSGKRLSFWYERGSESENERVRKNGGMKRKERKKKRGQMIRRE